MKRLVSLLVAIASLFGLAPIYSIIAVPARDSNRPEPEERGIIALDQSLRDLTNPFTVMCIAAHPEDVDSGTLAYYRKKLGARTVIALATRGEGRDSKTRGEMNEEMGVIRTGEALAFSRLLGADLYYLNLHDPGYLKSAEEALAAWGHDEALG